MLALNRDTKRERKKERERERERGMREEEKQRESREANAKSTQLQPTFAYDHNDLVELQRPLKVHPERFASLASIQRKFIASFTSPDIDRCNINKLKSVEAAPYIQENITRTSQVKFSFIRSLGRSSLYWVRMIFEFVPTRTIKRFTRRFMAASPRGRNYRRSLTH